MGGSSSGGGAAPDGGRAGAGRKLRQGWLRNRGATGRDVDVGGVCVVCGERTATHDGDEGTGRACRCVFELFCERCLFHGEGSSIGA